MWLRDSSCQELGGVELILLIFNHFSAQELHRCILWNAEWVRRFRVAIELGKSGGVVLKVLLEDLDASSIGRMVGKKLRNLPHISILKILKQPR
jgi:hypothetical protein